MAHRGLVSEEKSYSIAVLTLKVRFAPASGGRTHVVEPGGQLLTVEEGARAYFQEEGFVCLRGDDMHLAFEFLCGKFGAEDSTYFNWGEAWGFDRQTLKRWGQAVHKHLRVFLESPPKRLKALLENTEKRWGAYYKPVPEKLEAFALAVCDPQILQRIVSWYVGRAYDPRGVPDLFCWKKANEE